MAIGTRFMRFLPVAADAHRFRCERAAVAVVHAANILLVGAAGNDASDNDGATPYYPASYIADVLSVAATDSSDMRHFISNYGKNSVHLGAPGSGILTLWPKPPFISFGGGTSMAAAHVSGAAALAMSKCKLTADEAKNLLNATIDTVSDLANATITGGRLNVGRALEQCK
jgi:Subtilisin-like serine proteases